MIDATQVRALLAARRDNHSLPQPFYTDEAFHRFDIDAVFYNEWLFACNSCELRTPGDYLTLEIGTSSVVVVRGQDGEIHAFFNTCRHRGSRICTQSAGHAHRLVCPYHQWVYDLDGTLLHARQMPAGFDRDAHALRPVHVEIVCSMVYICLADTPPDIARFRETVTPYIAPHQPARTKVAFEMTLIEDANWKLVIENNRECYHCAGNHPELLATLVEFALPDDPEGSADFQRLMDDKARAWDRYGLAHRPADGGNEFRCIRLPFHRGAVSFTEDGSPACGKLLGDLVEPDLGSVRMFRVPNNWNHFLADHIIHFRILPLSATRTALRTTWLVHEDAVEGVDYDIDKMTAVWRATNDQDARLAANNQLGVASIGYTPGPYAPSEFMLRNFTNWYADKLTGYLDAHDDDLARARRTIGLRVSNG
ncbi:aromatic ring-hydroxylating oxygenase subunit alpha [Paraburkholderia sp. BCC1886]|uniref:aromatic ring-hydroxylating oxygenase subunit alpha n=1 Tax=Paraburkholderia sp. BCC1886 TaxID=2562670 RepID=UPI001C915DFC|nr:aromatic ring-hydroxylating dioxygenase subunit alpha [Paraburkholderia sp. BCC1886]